MPFEKMCFLLLFAFVLVFESIALDLKKNDPCVTPNQENATCTLFKDCEIITKAVSTFHPDAVKFAQESQCGFDTEEGLVCCGSSAYPKVNLNLLFTPKPVVTSTTTIAPTPQEEKVPLSTVSDEGICGVEASSSYRIKGGRITQFDEFPWLAALEYKSGLDDFDAGIRCGGSIINDKYVLTAAHCIIHVEFVVIRAWLGITNISSVENCLNLNGILQCVNSTLKADVEKAIPHELYNSSHGYNDIGLLKLKDKVNFTKYIRPICLPSLEAPSVRIGVRMMVAGWGVTEDHNSSKVKLKVDIPVQNDSICNELLKMEEREVTIGQLCAGGEKGKDSCQGDSGGPLMKDFINENNKIQWYQEGVVSYGVGCGIEGQPAVYTRVSRYIPWIMTKTDEPKHETHYGGGDGTGHWCHRHRRRRSVPGEVNIGCALLSSLQGR